MRIVLNLAFIRKEALDEIDFTPEGIDEHYRQAKQAKEQNQKQTGLTKADTVYEPNDKS